MLEDPTPDRDSNPLQEYEPPRVEDIPADEPAVTAAGKQLPDADD